VDSLGIDDEAGCAPPGATGTSCVVFMERLPSSEFEDIWVSAVSDKPSISARSDAQPGRWFITRRLSEGDALWVAVRDACRAGKLGRGVRCTTAHPRLVRRYSGSATLQVVTDDWRDAEDVWGVENALRRLGATGMLVYKIDPEATGPSGFTAYKSCDLGNGQFERITNNPSPSPAAPN
jgi:hypothetical protein